MLKFFRNNEKLSDSEFLSLYIETGNLEVLGELYARYIHLVYGVCLKYLKNKDDSKDAVNQIFERLIIEIPKFEIQNFKSWLYVVVKNHCLMQLRQNKTQKSWHEKYSKDIFMESSYEPHPIDEDLNSGLSDKLKLCIEKLKTEQRKSVVLFYYENKCYKEISETLKVSEAKVKSYIQNGKRNLKMCMEQ